jgi:hypothetical protein
MCWTKEQITNVSPVKIVELMRYLVGKELAVSPDTVGYGNCQHKLLLCGNSKV